MNQNAHVDTFDSYSPKLLNGIHLTVQRPRFVISPKRLALMVWANPVVQLVKKRERGAKIYCQDQMTTTSIRDTFHIGTSTKVMFAVSRLDNILSDTGLAIMAPVKYSRLAHSKMPNIAVARNRK
jgi:hypothetical protein